VGVGNGSQENLFEILFAMQTAAQINELRAEL
jgi:hypothetical protein